MVEKKESLGVAVYLDEHTLNAKKQIFARQMYFSSLGEIDLHSLTSALRVLFGANCIIHYEFQRLPD